MAFALNPAAPGVTHIRDGMGACFTLLEGEKRALLVDTGYGVEDAAAFIGSLIGNKPLDVFLTHGHHDHILGLRTLAALPDCEALMLAADAPVFHRYAGLAQRRAVLQSAQARGFALDEIEAERFLHDRIDMPCTAHPGDIDLGGLTARVIGCPGHTPGSAAVLIPERKILLTGDCWNPCTWAFFPEALGVGELRRQLRFLQAYDFTHVLCSHQHQLYPRAVFDAFVDGLTDAALAGAIPVDVHPHAQIDTRQMSPAEGQSIVFDAQKAQL